MLTTSQEFIIVKQTYPDTLFNEEFGERANVCNLTSNYRKIIFMIQTWSPELYQDRSFQGIASCDWKKPGLVAGWS